MDAAEALRRAWAATAEGAGEDDAEAVRRSAQALRAWLRRSGEARDPGPRSRCCWRSWAR
ncbi:MAG: hypothetical protein H6704_04620 [Myxococcales bacterium]|nr:hypothetical protein [Myxococcales bacterium]